MHLQPLQSLRNAISALRTLHSGPHQLRNGCAGAAQQPSSDADEGQQTQSPTASAQREPPAADAAEPPAATSSPEPQQRARQPRVRSVQASLVSQSLAIAPLEALQSAGGSGDDALLRISSGGAEAEQHDSDGADAVLPSPSLPFRDEGNANGDATGQPGNASAQAQASDVTAPPLGADAPAAEPSGGSGATRRPLFSQLSPSAAMRAVCLQCLLIDAFDLVRDSVCQLPMASVPFELEPVYCSFTTFPLQVTSGGAKRWSGGSKPETDDSALPPAPLSPSRQPNASPDAPAPALSPRTLRRTSDAATVRADASGDIEMHGTPEQPQARQGKRGLCHRRRCDITPNANPNFVAPLPGGTPQSIAPVRSPVIKRTRGTSGEGEAEDDEEPADPPQLGGAATECLAGGVPEANHMHGPQEPAGGSGADEAGARSAQQQTESAAWSQDNAMGGDDGANSSVHTSMLHCQS